MAELAGLQVVETAQQLQAAAAWLHSTTGYSAVAGSAPPLPLPAELGLAAVPQPLSAAAASLHTLLANASAWAGRGSRLLAPEPPTLLPQLRAQRHATDFASIYGRMQALLNTLCTGGPVDVGAGPSWAEAH